MTLLGSTRALAQQYFPSFDVLGDTFQAWADAVMSRYAAARGAEQFVHTPISSNAGTAGSNWSTSSIAPNGKIYCAPERKTNIAVIDTNTDTYFEIATAGFPGDAKFFSSAYVPSVNKIYALPYDWDQILKIDPDTDTYSLIPCATDPGNQFFETLLANNGFIYGAPHDGTQLIKFDPSTDTFATFGAFAAGDRWLHGSIAPNGDLFFLPANGSATAAILKVDPSTDTPSISAAITPLDYHNLVLAPNGYLYMIPYNATTVGKFDPVLETFSTFGTVAGGDQWHGGTLAPNGKIYCQPRDADTFLVIDTLTDTVEELGDVDMAAVEPTFGKFRASSLAANGAVYMMNRYSNAAFPKANVAKIDTVQNLIVDPGQYLSRYNA